MEPNDYYKVYRLMGLSGETFTCEIFIGNAKGVREVSDLINADLQEHPECSCHRAELIHEERNSQNG